MLMNENEKKIKDYLLNYNDYVIILNIVNEISNKNNIEIEKIYNNNENDLFIIFNENEILNECLNLIKNNILKSLRLNENEIFIIDNKLIIDLNIYLKDLY